MLAQELPRSGRLADLPARGWASRGPRRKRRAPGLGPVPGHDGDDGGGEAELRELGLAVSRLAREVCGLASGSEG